jgi:hypothetical protein
VSFDLTCPYCDKDVKPCEDSRDQSVNIEKECPHCEKTFLYQIEYEPTYQAWEVPCLNGGEHDYRRICGAPAEYFINRRRCHHCSKEIKLEPV